MKRDMSTIFIAATDMFLCVLAVVIVAVAPSKAKVDGVKPPAEFLIQMTYDVGRDVDLDLWLSGPSHKPVFYGSRQVGCADLDRDSLGASTQVVTLADGSSVHAKENVETIAIRCLEPGRYNAAVNLFSYHGDSGAPITPSINFTGLNPNVRILWADKGDLTFTRLGQTINAFSFDLDKDGHVTLVSVPLEPVTSAYEREKAGGAP